MTGDEPVKRRPSVLQSLNCDGRRGVGLLLACAGLMLPALCGPSLTAILRFERTSIAAGEAWRLLTGHLVHLDLQHALLNVIGLCLLWTLFAGFFSAGEALFILLLSMASIDVGFWLLDPSLQWYVGASGLLHGVMAAGTLQLLRLRDRIAWPTLALFLAKLAWEQWQGPLPLESTGPVIVNAHLYGAAGGLAAGMLLWARVAIMRALQHRAEHD